MVEYRLLCRYPKAIRPYCIEDSALVVRPPLVFYIDVAEVECVEVRKGFMAAQEFNPSLATQTYSGVILIWTRGSLGNKPQGCTGSP